MRERADVERDPHRLTKKSLKCAPSTRGSPLGHLGRRDVEDDATVAVVRPQLHAHRHHAVGLEPDASDNTAVDARHDGLPSLEQHRIAGKPDAQSAAVAITPDVRDRRPRPRVVRIEAGDLRLRRDERLVEPPERDAERAGRVRRPSRPARSCSRARRISRRARSRRRAGSSRRPRRPAPPSPRARRAWARRRSRSAPTLRLKNSFWLTMKRSVTPVQTIATFAPFGTASSIQSRSPVRIPENSAPAEACLNPCSPNQTLFDTTAK